MGAGIVANATTTDAARVAEARRWFKLLGHEAVADAGATIVATPEHPDTWDANFALPGAETTSDALLAALDRNHAHGDWRVVITDALAPPAIEAGLALAGFATSTTLIEMVAHAITPPRTPPAITTDPVVSDADWAAFAPLVEIDHREGLRTGPYDPHVAAGLFANMRRCAPPCEYRVIRLEGEVAGYGMTARCPNGLALIENLFTRAEFRGRGIMSAFIAGEFARLGALGCDAMFLDAHAHDTPKHLYARLGFAPVALTRTWTRQKLR